MNSADSTFIERRLDWLGTRQSGANRNQQSLNFKFADPDLRALYQGIGRHSLLTVSDAATMGRRLDSDVDVGDAARPIVLRALGTALDKGFELSDRVSQFAGDRATDSPWAWWTMGTIEVGDFDDPENGSPTKLRAQSAAFGLDRTLGDDEIVGLSLTVGTSDTEYGRNRSSLDADRYGASVYYQRSSQGGFEWTGQIDYGLGDIHSIRFEADETLVGQRDSRELAASVGLRQRTQLTDRRSSSWYARLERSRSTLDTMEERGGLRSLDLGEQTIDVSTGRLGLDLSERFERANYWLRPFGGLEAAYTHTDNSEAEVAYVLTRTNTVTLPRRDRHSKTWSLDMGLEVEHKQSDSRWTLAAKHEETESEGYLQRFTLRFDMRF